MQIEIRVLFFPLSLKNAKKMFLLLRSTCAASAPQAQGEGLTQHEDRINATTINHASVVVIQTSFFLVYSHAPKMSSKPNQGFLDFPHFFSSSFWPSFSGSAERPPADTMPSSSTSPWSVPSSASACHGYPRLSGKRPDTG